MPQTPPSRKLGADLHAPENAFGDDEFPQYRFAIFVRRRTKDPVVVGEVLCGEGTALAPHNALDDAVQQFLTGGWSCPTKLYQGLNECLECQWRADGKGQGWIKEEI